MVHLSAFCDFLQDPNDMNMRREHLPRAVMAHFEKQHMLREKYRVASRLWATGAMSWPAAKQLANDAFREYPGD